MKILITGASGFIGSFLSADLCAKGHMIVKLDRQRFDNCSQYAARIFKGCDVVIHCAGIAHTKLQDDQSTMEKVFDANVHFTDTLAEMSVKFDVKKFVFLSSSKVYGDCSKRGERFTENDTTQAKDLYAKSKVEAELKLNSRFKNERATYHILRLPLVYSIKNKANLEKLTRLVKMRLPLPFAQINNKRSILHIGNLVDVIEAMILDKSLRSGTFNICDDVDVTTTELINILARVYIICPRLFYVSPKFMKTIFWVSGKYSHFLSLWCSFQIDNMKIKNELNWTPRYRIHDLIKGVK